MHSQHLLVGEPSGSKGALQSVSRGQRTGNGLSPGVRKALREDDIPELSCMGWTGVGQTRKGDGALSRGSP